MCTFMPDFHRQLQGRDQIRACVRARKVSSLVIYHGGGGGGGAAAEAGGRWARGTAAAS